MTIHIVKKGDTLYKIADMYGVPLDILLEVNGLSNPSTLSVGEAVVVLFPKTTHIVSAGETLFSISRKYNTTVDAIYRNNPSLLGLSDITPGDILVIEYEGDDDKRPALAVSGYVYPSVNETTLERTLPYLTYITPFSYGFTNEGELVPLDDEAIIGKAKNYGVSPVMLLTTLNDNGVFDNTLSNALLNDDELIDHLLEMIRANMRIKGYRILDVDFEFVYPQDREAYVNFINRAKEYLSPYGYEVWVALAPKTSADQPGLLYEAHDYNALGKAVDRVLLMTYEWGYTYGPSMAVAPLNKVREVLEYALSEIPAEKIFLGIPNYGYDFTLPYQEGVSKAQSLSNTAATELAYTKNAEILFDETAMSPYFVYYEDGVKHEVWFEDARSIQAKLALADDSGLFGVGYWNLMNWFPQNFAVLNALYNIR